MQFRRIKMKGSKICISSVTKRPCCWKQDCYHIKVKKTGKTHLNLPFHFKSRLTYKFSNISYIQNMLKYSSRKNHLPGKTISLICFLYKADVNEHNIKIPYMYGCFIKKRNNPKFRCNHVYIDKD